MTKSKRTFVHDKQCPGLSIKDNLIELCKAFKKNSSVVTIKLYGKVQRVLDTHQDLRFDYLCFF